MNTHAPQTLSTDAPETPQAGPSDAPETPHAGPSDAPDRAGLTRAQDVAGYVRVSVLQYPPGCEGPEARSTHRDALSARRRAELAADAARDGRAVTVWYEDLGVSGRTEAKDRDGLARLGADAAAGRLAHIYVRDLGRLFRNAAAQEHWFAEMETRRVEIHAADLPAAADPSARRLARQQLGAIHEFLTARLSAVVRAVLREKVWGGTWVGPATPRWGLRRDPAGRGFVVDPETADKARLVFETFLAASGLPTLTARRLNALLDGAHPQATPPPRGGAAGRTGTSRGWCATTSTAGASSTRVGSSRCRT